MALTVEQAAQRMGMKPHREVISVVETADGDVVTTHDGNNTLIRPDGSMVFKVAAPVVRFAEFDDVPARIKGEDGPEVPVADTDFAGYFVATLDNPFAAPVTVDAESPPVVAAPSRPARRAKVKAAE